MNINDVSRRWRNRPTAPAPVIHSVLSNANMAGQETPSGQAPVIKEQEAEVVASLSKVSPAHMDTAVNNASVISRSKLNRDQRRSMAELQRVWQRLAVNILASNAHRVPWAMGISSSIRGEGRTTAALGIAYAITRETGDKVALLELDLENPSISEEISPGSTPGLVEYLRGECDLEQTYRSSAAGKITVVSGGSGWKQSAFSPTLDDLAVRLRHQIPDIIETLKQDYKYTIVDLPPVLSNMQTERIAMSLNGTLMVVRSGITPLNLIRESVDLMGGENLLGAIQVGPPSPVPGWLSNLLGG